MSNSNSTAALSDEPVLNRRNYRFGVANGILFALADSLNNASFVLALLIRQLGGSLTLVAFIPTLQIGGSLLPQLLISGHLQSLPYKLPIYRRAAVWRSVMYLGMTIGIFTATSVPSWLALTLITGLYILFCFGGGVSALAFQDIVAKTIPPRWRGRFFGTRQLVGGLLALLVAGPLVRLLVAETSPLPFPSNYGLLSLLSVIGMVGCFATFWRIDEPPQEQIGPRVHLLDGLRRMPAILQTQSNYRWYIISRVMTRAGQIGEPLYLIYATEVLHLSTGMAGVYLGLRALAGVVSNFYWGPLSDTQGNRPLLVLTSIMFMFAPLILLLGPMLTAALGLGETGYIVVTGLVFLLIGVATDGSMIANIVYLIEVAPDNERPTYSALASAVLGITAFLPVVGGWLVGIAGYEFLFGVATVMAGLGVVSVLRLTEIREPTAATTVSKQGT